jgi:hypothetical protein
MRRFLNQPSFGTKEPQIKLKAFAPLAMHNTMKVVEPAFHQFLLLPIEIRTEIWKLALTHPRIVSIKYCTDEKKGPTFSLTRKSLDSPTPPLLYVNHESRSLSLVLEIYTRHFTLPTSRGAIFLDLSKDSLELDSEAMIHAPASEIQDLKKVVWNVTYQGRTYPVYRLFRKWFMG